MHVAHWIASYFSCSVATHRTKTFPKPCKENWMLLTVQGDADLIYKSLSCILRVIKKYDLHLHICVLHADDLHYLFLPSLLDHAIDERRATQSCCHWSIPFLCERQERAANHNNDNNGFVVGVWMVYHTSIFANCDKTFSKILFHWKSRIRKMLIFY